MEHLIQFWQSLSLAEQCFLTAVSTVTVIEALMGDEDTSFMIPLYWLGLGLFIGLKVKGII